jgi:hypothetical protein
MSLADAQSALTPKRERVAVELLGRGVRGVDLLLALLERAPLEVFLSSGVCLRDDGMVCLRLFVFLPRDSGEGGPRVARWKGRGA